MKALQDILTAIQNGDQNAFALLLEGYQPLVSSMAQSFHASCPDADLEDLIQEASLALSDAANTYRMDSPDVTFGLYAKICIRNRLISVQRKYRRKTQKKKVQASCKSASPKKKISLTASFSLDECKALLSRFENEVLTLYADGRSYSEIAKELDCDEKSVDNALYRIKRKIRNFIHPQ